MILLSIVMLRSNLRRVEEERLVLGHLPGVGVVELVNLLPLGDELQHGSGQGTSGTRDDETAEKREELHGSLGSWLRGEHVLVGTSVSHAADPARDGSADASD